MPCTRPPTVQPTTWRAPVPPTPGQLQSLAALLRESFGLFELADALFAACNTVLAKGLRTADIRARGKAVIYA